MLMSRFWSYSFCRLIFFFLFLLFFFLKSLSSLAGWLVFWLMCPDLCVHGEHLTVITLKTSVTRQGDFSKLFLLLSELCLDVGIFSSFFFFSPFVIQNSWWHLGPPLWTSMLRCSCVVWGCIWGTCGDLLALRVNFKWEKRVAVKECMARICPVDRISVRSPKDQSPQKWILCVTFI